MPVEPPYGSHFGRLAARYDDLRRDPSDRDVAELVAAGDLRGRRVLDIGCGTGRVAARLAAEYDAAVVGVEPSEEMLAGARERGLEVVCGSAEELPFPDDCFEGALMQMVLHLTDRPRALAEARRVLSPGGRLVIRTLDPAGVDDFWLARWFPSYPEIDRNRFPGPEVLEDELRRAGFEDVRTTRRVQPIEYTRERALELLRGRFASSFALIPDDEYEEGLRRAERELPDPMRTRLRLATLAAG